MENILNIIQIAISVLLVATILFQNREGGLGGAFGGGGGGSGGGTYFKKRGIEKIMFTATIVLATLFILSAIARMII